MKKNKLLYVILFTSVFWVSCKNQLEVGNPNSPTFTGNVNNESGLISFAQGGVYVNGFVNGNGWLGDSYFSLPWGYAELLADNVGADASNNQITTIGQPDYIIMDNGTKITNSAPSVSIIRSYNNRAASGNGNNAIYYQWASMYALNNACNTTLELVDGIKFSGDQASKVNTVKAWCYWWKGFAYSQIGSMYYAGVIQDKSNTISSNYVLHDAIIEESNKNFNLASNTLGSITSIADYSDILGKLIPIFCQKGNGGVLTVDMWKRNINTMLARNILLNKLAPFVNGNPNATISKASIPTMTAADWNSVKTLTTNGVKKGDFIFTGRSVASNTFFTASGGTVAALSVGKPVATTFKISERFIQNFKSGDKRLDNNFTKGDGYKNDYIYTTRYEVEDGGTGMPGVYVYGSTNVGDYELIIAGSYEENALMLAEANIRTNNIDAGLTLIDEVRGYLGAGIPAVSGTGLTLAQALTELTRERRVALVFRGLSFYDNRRWGWSYSIANGGGSYGNTIVTSSFVINSNVTINYNFMDYWDVPADETVLNPPSEATKSLITNPNF
jgi:hypothetical protein